MRIVGELIRVAVLLAAATSGIAAFIGYMILADQGVINPPGPVAAAGKPPPEVDLIVFESCIVFFSVAYAVGASCYRWAGAWDDHQIVVGTAEQHIPLLHLMGSVEMLAVHLPKVMSGSARPVDWLALAIGAVLARTAFVGLRRAIRKYHPFGLGRRKVNDLETRAREPEPNEIPMKNPYIMPDADL